MCFSCEHWSDWLDIRSGNLFQSFHGSIFIPKDADFKTRRKIWRFCGPTQKLCYTPAALILRLCSGWSTHFGNCFDLSERTPAERVVGLFCWASCAEKQSSGWQEGSENGVIETSRIASSLRGGRSPTKQSYAQSYTRYCL